MSAKRILPIESDHDTGAVLRRRAGASPRRPLVLELRRRPSPAPRLLLPLRQLRPRSGGRSPAAGRCTPGRSSSTPPTRRTRCPTRWSSSTSTRRRTCASPATCRGGRHSRWACRWRCGGTTSTGRPSCRTGDRAVACGPRVAPPERHHDDPMTSSSPLGDPLPPALAAYWQASMPAGSAMPPPCFSRDALLRRTARGDVETAPRTVTTGSAALLERFVERRTAALAARRPPLRRPMDLTPSSRERGVRSRGRSVVDVRVQRPHRCRRSHRPVPRLRLRRRPRSSPTDVDERIEPADASAVVRDYFADLDGGRFAAAAARFSADVLYSHPPYQHTGIDDPDRIEFRGRPALRAAFDAPGQGRLRPRRHHVDPARPALHLRRSRARAARRRAPAASSPACHWPRRHDPPIRQLLLRTGRSRCVA